jgi:hypothetical protein
MGAEPSTLTAPPRHVDGPPPVNIDGDAIYRRALAAHPVLPVGGDIQLHQGNELRWGNLPCCNLNLKGYHGEY